MWRRVVFLMDIVVIRIIMHSMHTLISSVIPLSFMSSGTADSGIASIKRIPVKEPTWRDLHNLKEAGQSFDELIAAMIRREQDFREWKMICEIDRIGEFIPFDPEEIMQDD